MSKMTIDKHGNQFWKNEAGRFHRIDGPVIIYADGSQEWHIDGKLHRLDRPAYIDTNGSQVWYINGERHRLDGPAVIGADRRQSWWINGVQITDHATAWIKENDFPDYTLWTDSQKIMFRLAFSGISS